MFRLRSQRPARGVRCGPARALLVSILLIVGGAAVARDARLALDVRVNGHETKLIGNFVMRADQRMFATRKELRELGIEPGAGADEESLALDAIEGITYRYDAERQVLNLQVADRNLATQMLGPPQEAQPSTLAAASEPGAVINYGLTVAMADADLGQFPTVDAWAWADLATLSLDARVFGPLGNLVNTGIIGSGAAGNEDLLRLDTTWSWSDPHRLWTWSAGDLMTRGPAWTRPVRLGGLQWGTNFALRPDLITVPQPLLGSSAAVPSSVDVFINNTKAYSGEVRPGPFLFSNLPATTGAGVARIVVRDAAGRETVQDRSFYTSPTLLRGGLFEHSVEVGLARRNYGLTSDDYNDRPAAAASIRYGYSDWLTLEAHAEGMQDQASAGAGIVATLFDRAVVSMAASLSHGAEGGGLLLYAALESKLGPVSLNLSSQRTFGTYKDLAAVIAQPISKGIDSIGYLDPPRALDIASLSVPLGELGGSVSLNIINRESGSDATRLLSASYSRQLFGETSLLFSGFHDLATSASMVYAGLSVPLGRMGHLHSDASSDGTRAVVGVDYSRVAMQEPGSLGWRVSERRAGAAEARSGAITYHSTVARLEAGVEQIGSALRLRTLVDGAVVLSSHGPILSHRIDDAFAVVNVGHPGVPVSLENRVVAITDDSGLALVPGMRSYQPNRISIDPDVLPADVTVPEVRAIATPADRGGVTVHLTSRRTHGSAVVVFRNADGGFIEPGSEGRVDVSGGSFVVGYDGRAYIEDLAGENRVSISTPAGNCTASFALPTVTGAGLKNLEAVCR